MGKWCNDCAWPVECAAEGDCYRRRAGEVRRAAVADETGALRAVLDGYSESYVFADTAELLRRAYLGRGA